MARAPDGDDGLPPGVRLLKWLVIGLTATLIVGVMAITFVIVLRLSTPAPGLPPLPASIALPPGAVAQAFTQGRDWIAVVTQDDRILIYDRAGGRLRQTLTIAP